LIATVVYFMIVAPMNYVMSRTKKPVVEEVTTKTCPQCLSDIPLAAQRCKFCTQAV
jgi:large conductance mechanosensitive channel